MSVSIVKHTATLTKYRFVLLIIYGILVAARCPWLLLRGRIWAEEGTVYLQSAWTGSAVDAFFAPHLGYYALWPNSCGLLAARVFPLPDAGIVLTWCAFLLQLLAGYVVVECEALETVRAKAAGLAVLLLATSLEAWLNTVNDQFYLAVCAAIILISNSERHQFQRCAVLALAALTGPMTVVLAPLFLLRGLWVRTRAAWIQAGLLLVCSCVQFAVIFRSMATQVRHNGFEAPAVTPVFLVRYVCRPFLGRVGETIAAVIVLHESPSQFLGRLHFHLPLNGEMLLLYGLLDTCFVALLLWVTRDSPARSSWWLIAAGVFLALFSMYGALEGTYSMAERYVLSSAALFGLSLATVAFEQGGSHRRRTVARLLLLLFVLGGAMDFVRYNSWAERERPAVADWRMQAIAWEKDPTAQLVVWPRNWAHPVVHLSPDRR